jgi:copper chaperone CopZ
VLSGRLRSSFVTEHVYTVEGMTCAHCVAAVSDEVSQVPGAERVEVNLETGRLAVSGEGVDTAAVREAVTQAGYSLA